VVVQGGNHVRGQLLLVRDEKTHLHEKKGKPRCLGESGASGRDMPQWEMGGPTRAISRDAAAALRRDGGRTAVVHASHIASGIRILS